MKVLQLGKFYPIRGGVEKVMWDVTAGLSAEGVDCDMLCATLDSDPVDDEDKARITETDECKVIRFNGHGRVLIVRAMAKIAATMISPAMVRYLRRHCSEYDIIHVHHPDPMAALALFLSGYKGRVFLHWHSDILSQKAFLMLYKPLQSWLIRRAEKVVGTTPVYVRDSPYLKKVQDKTTYIPIGIRPVEPEEAKVKEIKKLYKDKKIVFSLGRLVPYKGFEYLVQAARNLPDDYIVLIGGKGPLDSKLRGMISAAGLEDKVKLLGFMAKEDVPAHFGACDVFVLSSVMKTEAFGIVQIEAMSCGKPVVATRIPESGVSWVNKHGYSGINVEIMDPEALSDAITSVCSDNKIHEKFSNNAINHYLSIFTEKGMISNFLNLYEERTKTNDCSVADNACILRNPGEDRVS